MRESRNEPSPINPFPTPERQGKVNLLREIEGLTANVLRVLENYDGNSVVCNDTQASSPEAQKIVKARLSAAGWDVRPTVGRSYGWVIRAK